MPKKSDEYCMFCDMGECPAHAPKAKVKPQPRKIKAVELPAPVEAKPDRTSQIIAARAAVDASEQKVFADAIRALAPLLCDADLIKYRACFSSDIQLRVNRWRRERRISGNQEPHA